MRERSANPKVADDVGGRIEWGCVGELSSFLVFFVFYELFLPRIRIIIIIIISSSIIIIIIIIVIIIITIIIIIIIISIITIIIIIIIVIILCVFPPLPT